MFDLENALSDWRAEMAAGASLEPESLDELESHLRESISAHIQQGRTPREAFQSAVAEMGNTRAIGREFRRGQPIVVALQCFFAFVLLMMAGFACRLACLPELTAGWRLAALLNASAFIGAILGRKAIVKIVPIVPNKKRRDLLGVAAGIIAMIGAISFINFVLPRLELTIPQLGIVTLWAATLTIFIGAAGAALDEAAKRRGLRHT